MHHPSQLLSLGMEFANLEDLPLTLPGIERERVRMPRAMLLQLVRLIHSRPYWAASYPPPPLSHTQSGHGEPTAKDARYCLQPAAELWCVWVGLQDPRSCLSWGRIARGRSGRQCWSRRCQRRWRWRWPWRGGGGGGRATTGTEPHVGNIGDGFVEGGRVFAKNLVQVQNRGTGLQLSL